MPHVRTTMQPYLVQTVSDSEYTDLERQGLIYETVAETKTPLLVTVVTNKKEG